MILAIDAGNTRTKWGVFDSQDGLKAELKVHGACLNSELDAQPPVAWHSCKRAVVSNVAGEAVAAKIAALLQPLAIEVRHVAATASACGVKNGYSNPNLLGTDRWAALIAVWQHYHAPCVVVNAGTALTIDALAADDGNGIFLGGLIVPGLRLMQESLVKKTDGIEFNSGEMRTFPANTADAVHTGALSAMVGAIASMMVKLEKDTSTTPHCILSGGDAAVLADALRSFGKIANNVVIADNLVLQGLLALEIESYRSMAE
jgi:type III pantothenate kinase